MASIILKRAFNFTPPIFARTHRTAKTNNLYSTINPFGPGDANNISQPPPMASTILKKALYFKPTNPPILPRTHATAKASNLYSTINPFGPADPNNIPFPTPVHLTILKKALNFTPINTPIFARTYCTAKRKNLYDTLIYVYDPNSIVPVLDQWVQEGNKVEEHEIQHIVEVFYESERFENVAQVFEWVRSKDLPFPAGDCYMELGSIFKLYGLEAAESYFFDLHFEDLDSMVHYTLLQCYFEEGLVDKCIPLLEKMMRYCFLFAAPCYNDLLFLYAYRGQFEKIPDVLSNMKKNGVSPDDFSYRICIHAYGLSSDISSIELILEEMENQPHINVDWSTYVIVANVYVKAGLRDKALIYLNKCLSNVIYAKEMRSALRFLTKFGCLVKTWLLNEAEKFFKEQEWCFLTPLAGRAQVNNGFIKWTH